MTKHRKASIVTEKFTVKYMECNSCEKIIEKQALSLKGVKRIKTDFSTGTGEVTYDRNVIGLDNIFKKINEKGYVCYSGEKKPTESVVKNKRSNILLILGALAILAGGYFILQTRFNLGSLPNLDQNTSLAMLFIVGLLTGFHCIAMCGGFVVSYASKNVARDTAGGISLKSHLIYGFGKTLSYTIIGAVFGFIGSFLTFTPLMRGAVAILAGLFLIMFGLNTLDFLIWFRRFRFKTPSFIENSKWAGGNHSPLVIGLLNGLMIACGPLQAIYIFAAASGSAYYGALYLLAFGLGTLPVLLGFGVLTSFVSAQFTHKVLRFSGVAVIILGVIMLNRGLMLTGTGYDFSTLMTSVSAFRGSPDSGKGVVGTPDAVKINSPGYQEIRMEVNSYGWKPDTFVLKRGVPVKWIIDGREINNCNKAIQVPKLGLNFDIKPGLQTIEFTPTEAGIIPWSCWMGMIPGKFIVKDDVNTDKTGEASALAATTPAPAGSPASAGVVSTVVNTSVGGSSAYQEIYMDVLRSGWSPNKFVLKRGVPVKWVINGKELTGCNSGIKVPKLGLQFDIKQGLQTIEFTPTEEGTIPWSCWMGMIKGVFIVKNDVNVNNKEEVQKELNNVQVPSGGGSCGCGGMMRR